MFERINKRPQSSSKGIMDTGYPANKKIADKLADCSRDKNRFAGQLVEPFGQTFVARWGHLLKSEHLDKYIENNSQIVKLNRFSKSSIWLG